MKNDRVAVSAWITSFGLLGAFKHRKSGDSISPGQHDSLTLLPYMQPALVPSLLAAHLVHAMNSRKQTPKTSDLHSTRWFNRTIAVMVCTTVLGTANIGTRFSSASAQDVAPVVAEDVVPLVTEDVSPVVAEDVAPLVAEDVAPVVAEDVAPVAADDVAPPRLGFVRFSFQATAWRDVLRWISDEADLALHVGDLPPGSFTYSDPNEFSHNEAIDRINLFLLPEGFAIIRSGKLLSVINLGDARSMKQLESIARLITVEQLDRETNEHDVVKCIFPLGELEPQDAVQELAALSLMSTPAVFEKTKRLLVTDTVAKLKSVKSILNAFTPDTMDNGTVVQSFSLKHVEAEDVLLVARPHLGLATDEMIGIDVSISADPHGKNIFVTGVEDKVKLIEGLVTAIDQPNATMSVTNGDQELRTHSIAGGNVEVVYNVLQTLLAGETVRLSMDEQAGTIVALATPEIQTEISETVAQIQASSAEFEIIPLTWVDPFFVIGLIEEMLDLAGPLDDSESSDLDAPKIDADPVNRRLFVRAKKQQLEQIKQMVEELDVNPGSERGDEVRFLSLTGRQGIQILKTAAKFWRDSNPIIFYDADEGDSEQTERTLSEPESTTTPKSSLSIETTLASTITSRATSGEGMLLAGNPHHQDDAIRCQLTSRGIILQSADTDALDQFEQHMQTIAGPLQLASSAPIVFYLKYTKVDEAIRMLAELLEGGEVIGGEASGSLVNGYVGSSTGSYSSSLVTSQDGTMTMISGNITVVADSRLNRLITQGLASDIERIQSYLEIIDKDTSITSIETHGTSRVIELHNTNASDVAAAIREAFPNRIADPRGRGPTAGSRAEQAQDNRAAQGGEKGNEKSGKKLVATTPPDLEPKMAIAVHEASNSLIVTAPEQLFLEVEQLVQSIDSRSEQLIEVVTPINGEVVETMLRQVLLGETRSSRASSTRSTSRPAGPQTRPTGATSNRGGDRR
ncbi:Bacterial type II/III secretion system short domain protein [Planctomycetes bacterium CA13]|uniref:Bacterial type II/III secretion system short domain protein n=1 Tax=Novipirellula herctigrandis TaxID=2527986 RepID=A0A5C5ZCQ0_9BACT|nr:Bacterial type II/III secretion system short domain protein [Planctomycetes bacterium CA13]